jgi:hypothetical protein
MRTFMAISSMVKSILVWGIWKMEDSFRSDLSLLRFITPRVRRDGGRHSAMELHFDGHILVHRGHDRLLTTWTDDLCGKADLLGEYGLALHLETHRG